MPSIANNSSVQPQQGVEVTCCTLSGGPFAVIDAYVKGGDNTALTFRLYSQVGSTLYLIAQANYLGSQPNLLVWTSSGEQIVQEEPLEAGAASLVLKAFVPNQSQQVNIAPVAVTLAAALLNDVAASTTSQGTIGLSRTNDNTVVTVTGYATWMDVGADLTGLPNCLFKIYASCGAGSVEVPVLMAPTVPLTSGALPRTNIIGHATLPVATQYRLTVIGTSDFQSGLQCTASVSTYSNSLAISGNVVFANNVTALRALAGAIGNVQLLGYNVPGDGGGGLFTYNGASTASDDGGIIFKPTAIAPTDPGRWIRNYDKGPINALWFGLVNDGVTANDAANTRLINSTAAQLGEGIFYPGGNYVFASTIGPYPIGGIVSGAGLSGRSTGLSSSIGTTFLFTGQGVGLQAGGHAPSSNVGSGATFQNFEVLGQNPNGNASFPNINEVGIEIITDVDVKLKNIRFGGFKYQLSFDGCESCVADGMYFDGIPPGGLGYPAAEMVTDNGVNSAFAARFGAFHAAVGASACNANVLTNVQLNDTYWAFFHQGGIGNSVINVNSELKGLAIFGGSVDSAATFQTTYQNIVGEGAQHTNFLILTSTYSLSLFNVRLGQDAKLMDIQAPMIGLNLITVYLTNTSVAYPITGSASILGGQCMGCLPPDGGGLSTANVIFDADPVMIVDTGYGTATPSFGLACQPLSPLDVNGNRIRIRNSLTPANSADAAGHIGDITWDANFLYVKTAAGWKRTAIAAF